uniref:Uncharacterized protein n=1 Tax=Siphoviridae sp. cte421 TaxID=2826402 RepID=A0A8S5M9H2_9CAUD|nr:MAG TPA: hypothetical protein [Siphoviridae sp. cte421]
MPLRCKNCIWGVKRENGTTRLFFLQKDTPHCRSWQ